MTISQWISLIEPKLKAADITSARLDCELLLSHFLNRSREWIIAHSNRSLTNAELQALNVAAFQRISHTPLAYIIGHKAFYGRDFKVTPDVLIPRPESEQIIDSLADIIDARQIKFENLLEVGTGSGCLAITAKLEQPQLSVTATDISPEALAVAHDNAEKLDTDIKFVQSDLLDAITGYYDVIIANLPYVNPEWNYLSPELKHEPKLALYADDDGEALIKKMIQQAPQHLITYGYLILEMDTPQIDDIIAYAGKYNFNVIDEKPFTLTLRLM